jgi:isopentenyldiphosphate isomerase
LGIPRDEISFEPIETYYTSRQAGDFLLNSFSRVYKISIKTDKPIQLDTSEATELRWFTPKELANALKNEPEKFAPSVALLLSKYYKS